MTQAVQFGAPQNLWLLLVLPLSALLLLLGWRGRQRARTAWAGQLFARLASGYDPRREWLKQGLVLAAWGCIVLALARPQWGGETVMMKRRGIDLMIAVDVSASMLAEDLRPNRLEHAKREITDLVRRMQGDRVGLIAFAGEAFTISPLTLDHGTVLLLLESLNLNSVSTPGTNLGAAIARARASFVAGEDKHKALVLVTDGESHEGDLAPEVQKAREEGLRIFAIGIGSPEGQPIPERDNGGGVAGYKKDKSGHVVNSRLDEETLISLSQETQGRYFRGSPQSLELAAVAAELQNLEKKELEGRLATSYEERFQWPLGLAVLLLGFEFVLPNRRRRRQADAGLAAAAALAALVLTGAGPGVSRQAATKNREGTQAYTEQRFDESVQKYTEALTEAPESPGISYNLGNALYRGQRLDEAAKALARAAQSEDPRLRHQSLHNLGNTFFRLGQLPEAVQAYRQALAANPHDRDTKINFEKALQLLQQQEEEKKKQQQQQKQEQQQGDEDQKQKGQEGEEKPQDPQEQQEQQQQEQKPGDEQQQQQPQEQEAQQAGGDSLQVPEGELRPEEALRILEAMRDQEEELQKDRALKARVRARRVEKDW